MSEHTPGPFERTRQNDGQYQIYAPNAGGGNGCLVAMVPTYSGNADADSQLIEAAPDLLAACECLIIGACAVAVPHDGERAVLQDAVDIARKAIAKATDEA
jgi:hypothetical protein